MKKGILIVFAGLLLAVSCSKKETGGGITPTPTPVIRTSVTAEASDIKCDSATISGKLTVESDGTFTKSAVLYYSSTESTLEALKSIGVKKTLTVGSNGEFSILLGTLKRETKYYCVVIAKVDDKEFNSPVMSFTTTKPSCPSGAVDLGLSVYWATCNIGASKPEEYGGYYQWAGTQDVTSRSINLYWDNCPYHTGSDNVTGWTKYVPSDKASYWSGLGSPDDKIVLDSEDDVAHVKLGGKWRIPTDDEWTELRENCTWTWTEQNGVNGYKVAGNKPGYTDKSIFLPAAGCRFLYTTLVGVGSEGVYWSSSLCADSPSHAYHVRCSGGITRSYDTRYTGLSVRPVSGSAPTPVIRASVTAEVSDIKWDAATISGKLTVNSKGDFTKSAVLYYSSTESTLEALKSYGTKKVLTLALDGSYSIDLTSLTSEAQYNYIVVAKVDDNEFYSGVKKFTAFEISASITAESSDVKCAAATISGKLTVESDGTFTKSAVLYYSSMESTLEALKSSGLEKTLTLASDGSYSAVAECPNDKTKYYFVVVAKVDYSEFASDVKSFTTVSYPVPELVDLGLSVKWATCNLGASKPEEYGGYYQWAGMQDVTSTSIYLDWNNCPYHTGSDEDTGWTKYVPSDKASYWSGSGSPDNKKVLDQNDDVACVKLGGKWRMPTAAEWAELADSCTWARTDNYNGTGVSGSIVTSNKPGYTDKSIFLPAAGFRSGGSQSGYFGDYWSSSLNAGNLNHAYSAYITSGCSTKLSDGRCLGLSVRPVSE